MCLWHWRLRQALMTGLVGGGSGGPPPPRHVRRPGHQTLGSGSVQASSFFLSSFFFFFTVPWEELYRPVCSPIHYPQPNPKFTTLYKMYQKIFRGLRPLDSPGSRVSSFWLKIGKAVPGHPGTLGVGLTFHEKEAWV